MSEEKKETAELSVKEWKAKNLEMLQERIRYVDSLPKAPHKDENVIEVSHLL